MTSHLRLVAKIAMGYRGYGLPVSDLISEGNVGLMQGVKKFEPDRGFRLATYAMWWIKASIQEFILRSWSLVKMGTTAAQKKLFFNLRRMKKNLDAYEDTDLHPDDVPEDRDRSRRARAGSGQHEPPDDDGRRWLAQRPMRNGEEGSGEWQDWLTDDRPLQDETVADAEEAEVRHDMLLEAMDSSTSARQHILTERRLTDNPQTLEELSAGLRRQPRAHPPDRGARIRKAAEGDAAHRGRKAAAGHRVTVLPTTKAGRPVDLTSRRDIGSHREVFSWSQEFVPRCSRLQVWRQHCPIGLGCPRRRPG